VKPIVLVCHALTGNSRPLEWWPETPEGWSGAWSRFTAIETPGTVVQVSQRTGPPAAGSPPAQPLSAGPLVGGPLAGRTAGAVTAAALLAIGVVCGLAGLFPGYLDGASLAQQPAQLVPHVIYLAAWTASAVLILLGGVRQRAGALLGVGTSAVTFGFFLADAGEVIAGGAHVAGPGLVLGLAGWLACAAGSAVAFRIRPRGGLGRGGGPRVRQRRGSAAEVARARSGWPSTSSITALRVRWVLAGPSPPHTGPTAATGAARPRCSASSEGTSPGSDLP